MSNWSVEFIKQEQVNNESYLEEFLQQAENKIPSLQIEDNVGSFESQLSNWDGFKQYYTNNSKFISKGAYIDIDELVQIHNRSNHSVAEAYKETENSVYEVYCDNATDCYPMIPFILKPMDFKYLDSGVKSTVEYKLLREGRSRLAGVKKARDNGHYNSDRVPVLFAIRRARK